MEVCALSNLKKIGTVFILIRYNSKDIWNTHYLIKCQHFREILYLDNIDTI